MRVSTAQVKYRHDSCKPAEMEILSKNVIDSVGFFNIQGHGVSEGKYALEISHLKNSNHTSDLTTNPLP